MPSEPLASGAARVRVTFGGVLNETPRGLYRGNGFVATQMQPTHARRVLPCFDEPKFKTTFDVTVNADATHKVISNAVPLSDGIVTDEILGERRRVTFARTAPIPTHLLAIAVGVFDSHCVAGENCAIAFHSPGNAGRGAFALEIARQSVAFYGQWLDRPYPFGKLDLLALPVTGVAGMENTAAVFLREAAVAVDPATASPSARGQAASLVAHELAHQWFGSLVSPASWADLWLNEGFATWMAPKVLAAIDPMLTSDAEEVRAIRLALDSDDPAISRPLGTGGETPQQIDELFDTIAYRKGAALLRMLEAWLGEAPFRKGLALYLARHAGGTATAGDLWRALQEATGVDVAAVAGPFTERAGAPQLTFAWQDNIATVSQTADDIRPVPVRLTVGLADGQRVSRALLLNTAAAQLEFAGPVLWAFGNADAAGYYRCLYVSAGQATADRAVALRSSGAAGRRLAGALARRSRRAAIPGARRGGAPGRPGIGEPWRPSGRASRPAGQRRPTDSV
jgi:aminopeptidase N